MNPTLKQILIGLGAGVVMAAAGLLGMGLLLSMIGGAKIIWPAFAVISFHNDAVFAAETVMLFGIICFFMLRRDKARLVNIPVVYLLMPLIWILLITIFIYGNVLPRDFTDRFNNYTTMTPWLYGGAIIIPALTGFLYYYKRFRDRMAEYAALTVLFAIMCVPYVFANAIILSCAYFSECP